MNVTYELYTLAGGRWMLDTSFKKDEQQRAIYEGQLLHKGGGFQAGQGGAGDVWRQPRTRESDLQQPIPGDQRRRIRCFSRHWRKRTRRFPFVRQRQSVWRRSADGGGVAGGAAPGRVRTIAVGDVADGRPADEVGADHGAQLCICQHDDARLRIKRALVAITRGLCWIRGKREGSRFAAPQCLLYVATQTLGGETASKSHLKLPYPVVEEQVGKPAIGATVSR